MKQSKALAVTVLLLLSIFTNAMLLADISEVPHELVVKLKPGIELRDVWNSNRAGIIGSIPESNMYLLEYDSDFSKADVFDLLGKNPNVVYVEPNYEMQVPENYQMSISFPDESRPPLLKGVSPADFFGLPGEYNLGTNDAFGFTTGEGVTVAVIDNGIEPDHPLFQESNVLRGRDILDKDNDPTDEGGSSYGHGTFVTGIILMNAPDCEIMPIRAFDGDGFGTSFVVARSIRWAAIHNADVINMSFGMEVDSKAISGAVDFASDRGIILIAACGNESTNALMYPAAYGDVIAVSAFDTNEEFADFSNYGTYIDVCAPGVDVYSSTAGEYNWGTWSGTSFAAPFVTAGCVLTLSEAPDMTIRSMVHHVRATARRELNWGFVQAPDERYGNGCINIFGMVSTATVEDDILCGDADGNGAVNPGDAHYIVRFVFKNGAPPVSMNAADVNCDMSVNEADATYLLNYLMKNGLPPCCMNK